MLLGVTYFTSSKVQRGSLKVWIAQDNTGNSKTIPKSKILARVESACPFVCIFKPEETRIRKNTNPEDIKQL